MAKSGVSGYAAISARVRAMYAALLAPQDLEHLGETVDFAALAGQLKNTAYGPYLESLKDKDITPRQVIHQLKAKLASAYTSIIQMAPEHTRPLLRQLYRYYEMDNLKAVLRAVVGRSAWERVRVLLFPFGEMTVLPAEAMVNAGSVGAAVELLRGTRYEQVLSFAMRRYSAEQNLFPIEVALDLDYWRGLWQETRRLTGQDHDQAMRVVGSLIDMNNLMWVIRYRVYHHLSEEELINYTLPFGYHMRDEDVRAIAAGADAASVVQRIYPDIPDLTALLAEPHTGLPKLELQLKRRVMNQCLSSFVGNPFHIGVPLAFLVLSDLEIQDLTVLIEAKSMQMSPDHYRPFLLRTIALRA